jgi:hypothetical protein
MAALWSGLRVCLLGKIFGRATTVARRCSAAEVARRRSAAEVARRRSAAEVARRGSIDMTIVNSSPFRDEGAGRAVRVLGVGVATVEMDRARMVVRGVVGGRQTPVKPFASLKPQRFT